VVEQTMVKHQVQPDPELPDILEADQWARRTARELAERGK
jgi:hypothetical protein